MLVRVLFLLCVLTVSSCLISFSYYHVPGSCFFGLLLLTVSFGDSFVCILKAEEMEGRPRSQPDDLINFRQLRSNALQAAELDIYDGDDIRSVKRRLFLLA